MEAAARALPSNGPEDRTLYIIQGTGMPEKAAKSSDGRKDFERELESEIAHPLKLQGRWGYRFVKRAFDIVFSLGVTVVLLIPSLILCIIISFTSYGSPLYVHKRIGQYGKPLGVLKFRTMYKDADKNPEDYFSPKQLAEWKKEFKVENDPRITKIGRWLRKTSLDELPQFLNVLSGKMSVIGPRPVVKDELEAYDGRIGKFLSVKPGITGWWQVEARNEAAYKSGERQELELYYADHLGLRLDAMIFFRTFGAIFKQTGK